MSQQALNDFKDTKRALKKKHEQLDELLNQIENDEHSKWTELLTALCLLFILNRFIAI